MTEKPHLFVLVATGQPVANLPPVLEIARPGDQVVWIVSEMARQRGWAEGSSKVLQRHGLKILAPVFVQEVNNPAELSKKLRPLAKRHRSRCRPVVVANGGNKLTPLGILDAFEDLAPRVLYNNDQPAELWLFEQGVFRRPTIRPYHRHTMDLDDVLEASDHEIHDRSRAEKLWPCQRLPEDLRKDDPYGKDIRYTGQLHEQHALWGAARRITNGMDVSYEELIGVLGEKRIERWKRSFNSIFFAIFDKQGSVKSAAEVPEEHWGIIYRTTLQLRKDALVNKNRQALQEPKVELGFTFERAVARRLLRWLNNRPENPAVQSLWRNVKVYDKKKRATVAEFDLLLVLRNGILLHIECKTFTVDQKDLDARLLNLQRAGSRLARMAVCVPLYTDFCDQMWFDPLHHLSQRVLQTPGLHLIPFTLENQPLEYQWRPLGQRKYDQFFCPRFEDSLEELLRPYEKHAG